MIKDLISEIAFDKIQLSQALNRSKLVAYKIQNENFKNWLRKELEGYDYGDKVFPAYRRINCQMFITHTLPNGQNHSKPVMVTGDSDKEFYEAVNYVKVYNPISVIEQQISGIKERACIYLTTEEAYLFSQNYKHQNFVSGGYREVGKSQFQNIIELTKQKLLDTLLELNNEFPNLSEFNNTKDNMEKVQNIITTNIYGDNNPLNIATGLDVHQKDINNIFNDVDYEGLEKLGVDKNEITQLKEIIKTHSKDKTTFTLKILKWLGSVSASVTAKGLYDSIPLISEFVHRFI